MDNELSITTWKYGGNIDSYCLININKLTILNLNDCVVSNEESAYKIKNSIKDITNNIDILFTQFGYANWISNKEDSESRKVKAEEKNKRIYIQNKILKPKAIIPFASFIFLVIMIIFYK